MTAVLRVLLGWLLATPVPRDLPNIDRSILYLARHRSRRDSLFLGLFLPKRPVVVLPREELRSRRLGWFLRFIPHLVMDVNDPTSVRKLLKLLAAGRSVVLYPEGRTFDVSAVMKAYEGPALVAARSGAAVVPVLVDYSVGLPRKVSIFLGKPHTLRIPAGMRGGRARRALLSRQIQRCLERAAVEARPRQTLFAAFVESVRREGRRREVIEDMKEDPRTYGELLKGALALGRWCTRFTQRHENVGVLLPNIIPTVCTVLGLTANGRVPAMLNYSAGSIALRTCCTAAKVGTVITSRAFIAQARLGPMVAALRHLRIVYIEDALAELTWRDKAWLMLYALRWPARASVHNDPDGPAVVLFTSGSENYPKGVVLSHDAVLANIRQIGAVIDFNRNDKVLNALPLYHSYGFTAGMMLCLVTGVQLFLYVSPLRYRAIPEIVYRRNVTYLFGTGTFLGYYAKHANPLDFLGLRYVISGGEKLGEEVSRLYVQKFGVRVFEGYGATECAPVISLATPKCYALGTVGRPLPCIEMKLERLEGIDHGGVLHLSGPNLMLGYYRHDQPGIIDPPRSQFGEGWYATGDVVDVSEDGVLQVVGRVKRFAKIAGEMVSLDAIEEVAELASPDHRHAVVLRTEVTGGETTVLFTTDPNLTRQTLMLAAREAGRQDLTVARRIVCMPELPLLGSGKTDYVTLQAVDLTEAAANEPILPQDKPFTPVKPSVTH